MREYQVLEEGNLDQKSPAPPGWGVDSAGQLPANRKSNLQRCPLKILRIVATYDDIIYVRRQYE
jgi:hypothetical protein